MAVFTDGKSYHIDIIGTDVQKRMAIREGLGWTVWSLTWQDVMERSDRKEESTAKAVVAPESLASGELTKQALAKHRLGEVSVKSSFDLLLEYLAAPDGDQRFRTYASATALGMLKLKESGDKGYSLEIAPEKVTRLEEHWQTLYRVAPLHERDIPCRGSSRKIERAVHIGGIRRQCRRLIVREILTDAFPVGVLFAADISPRLEDKTNRRNRHAKDLCHVLRHVPTITPCSNTHLSSVHHETRSFAILVDGRLLVLPLHGLS